MGQRGLRETIIPLGRNRARVSNSGTTSGLVGQILFELRIDVGLVVGLVLRVLDLDRYGSGGPLLLFLQGIYRH